MKDQKSKLENFFFDRLLNDPTRTSRLYIKKKPEGSTDYGTISNRDFYLVGVGFSNTINNVSINHNWGAMPNTSVAQKILDWRNRLSQSLIEKRDQSQAWGLAFGMAKELTEGSSGITATAVNTLSKGGEAVTDFTGNLFDQMSHAVGNMFKEKYITAGEAAKYFQGTDINLEPNITIPIVPRAYIASDSDPIKYKVWENGSLVEKIENENEVFKPGDIISTKWQLRKILNYLVGESGYGNFFVGDNAVFTEDQKDKMETSTIVEVGQASFKIGAMNKDSKFSPFLMQKSPNDYIGNSITFKYDCENTFRLVVGGRNLTGEDAPDQGIGSKNNTHYSEGNGAISKETANTSNVSSSIFDNLLLQNVSIEESNIKVNMTSGSNTTGFLTEDCPLYIILRLNFIPAYMYDKFQLYEALSLRDKIQTALRAG